MRAILRGLILAFLALPLIVLSFQTLAQALRLMHEGARAAAKPRSEFVRHLDQRRGFPAR